MPARSHTRRPLLALLVALATPATARAQDPPAPPACRPHHLRLYVYTTETIRPRHAEVVQKALLLRATVHSSAFAADLTTSPPTPRLAPGPVNDDVFLWRHRDQAWDRNTSQTRDWPFVAVLEYDGREHPEAWIDWFRRPRNSRDPGAWLLDPADQRYARHIGDAYATHRDDRFAYVAITDTPSGDVVFGNEWVVRGRVDWHPDEREPVARRAAFRVYFEKARSLADWHAVVEPLVEWVPEATPGRRGDARRCLPIEVPGTHCALLGSSVEFELPPVPATVVPARGFD